MSTAAQIRAGPIDTSKVPTRRILHFETLGQMMAEVDRLVATERAGKLKQVGNWTIGQILGHLAVWSEFAYTELPLNPPFFVRWLLRWRKKTYLYGPMRAGLKIPGVNSGTLGIEPMTLDDGLARLQRVIARLRVEPPTAPSKVFGMLTHEESIALNLVVGQFEIGLLGRQVEPRRQVIRSQAQ